MDISPEQLAIYKLNNEKIKEYLSIDPEAGLFMDLYSAYIHKIDDLIDEPKDTELILQTTYLATIIWTNSFFIRNMGFLVPIDIMINDLYANTVQWEKTEEFKEAANILRHAGLMMLCAVVYIVAGRDKMREISKLKWQQCIQQHNGDF